MELTQMYVYEWEEGSWKGLVIDEEQIKNQPHHIIMACRL